MSIIAFLIVPVDSARKRLSLAIVSTFPSVNSYAIISGASILGFFCDTSRNVSMVIAASCSIARSILRVSLVSSLTLFSTRFAYSILLMSVKSLVIFRRFHVLVMLRARPRTYAARPRIAMSNCRRSRICSCARSIAGVPSTRRIPIAVSDT